MIKETYEFIPGSVAALLYVRPPGHTGESIACVYLSKDRGVVVGRYEKPLGEYGWVMEVEAEITRYFDQVFALEHETWQGSPTPRAQFVDAAKPWTIEVGRPLYVVLDENTIGTMAGRDWVEPLAASVDGYDWKNGPVSTIGSVVRPALRADFERFRLTIPKGWRQP